MKSRSIILAIAVCCGTLSCIRSEEVMPERVTFRAVSGDALSSKTTLMEDGSVYWTPNDAISLFFGDLGSIQLTSDSKDTTETTTFSGTLDSHIPNGTDYFLAIYPYDVGNRYDGTEAMVSLPSTQTGMAGTFAKDLFISMARSKDYTLTFYNLCGGVKFSVENAGIQYVTFKGNNGERLAGTVLAAIDDNGKPQVTGYDTYATELRLDAPNGGFEVGKWYYIVSLPATLTAGYTMTFYDKDDAVVAKRERTASVELKRSIWRRVASADVDNTPISASKYLTFTSEGTSTVSLLNEGDNAPVLYYSTDAQTWTQWDYSELSFTANSPLYLCGNNPEGFSMGTEVYSKFVTGGDAFSVSGDIMSLLDKETDLLVIPSASCFWELFRECTGLTSGPSLPATTLTDKCYYGMFYGCSGLVSAPELPAETLATNCYTTMFRGCSSLTEAPVLPATTMTNVCYAQMFQDCTALETAPALPATVLASECYSQMFSNCSGLTSAPSLPATVLSESCYTFMFSGCTSLTVAPELPATIMADYCYDNMFSASGLTSAPALPATELAYHCYQLMFAYCYSLTSAPELPATELADGCYNMMFSSCTSLTQAPALPATTLSHQCYWDMFSGCTELTTAPELPAVTLSPGCYGQMFNGCTNLSSVKCLATDITAYDCLYNWLGNVSSQGTFVKAANVQWPTGASGIPEGWTVKDDGPVSVAEVYDLPDGWSLTLSDALVYAVGSRSFVVGDDAAENFINVYYGDDMPFGVNAGDRVTISASKITFMGVAEINNIKTVEILSSDNNLPEVAYSPEIGQYDKVTPVRVSGTVFQRSNSVYTFNYLLAMEENATNASLTIQYPHMYLYWPDSQYFNYNGQFVEVEGFWLFRNEAEQSNNGLHNLLIANLYEADAPYTDASVQEVLDGVDDMFYKVTATVSQIANTNYGNLYLTDNSSDSQLYVYGLYNLNGLYPKDTVGGWDGFGISENSVITVLGKRTTYNNTVQLKDATLISVSN